jgi:trehalose 6-phosphate synthase
MLGVWGRSFFPANQRVMPALELPLPVDNALENSLTGLSPHHLESSPFDLAEVDWTAKRLRTTLEEALGGHSLLVVANREPYIHELDKSGRVAVKRPVSGLVTALEPVLQACSGTWIAHGSGSADRQTVDEADRVAVPPENPNYSLRRIWLSSEEEDGYYYGFANQGLWPLCHVADVRPHFRGGEWEHYKIVNQRFAEACLAETAVDDPVILVQDYHFALVPHLLRCSLPRATVLTFWHIPWPNAERFGICPWYRELLLGLLGSSIVGFHTEQHCNNFMDACDRYLEVRIDREQRAIYLDGRATLIRAYPISIAWPNKYVENLSPRQLLRRELGKKHGMNADESFIGIGVDRLDYTKGIEERLAAVDEALAKYEELRGKLVFIQISAPSREKIGPYAQLAENLEKQVATINEKWAQGEYRPIVFLRAHHSPQDVFRYLRAADFCYVSSLHDGMNLVAKEFVAAREEDNGVLLLSRFTGAARELTEALLVNPYDISEASDAIYRAAFMSQTEQALRVRTMKRHVSANNVYRWAGQMLLDATHLRWKNGLSRRIDVESLSATPAEAV